MQNETDRLLVARTAPTLADLMLARGAQLPTVAPATTEQAVTAAEVIAEAEAITEDVAVIEIGEVPTDAPCSHPSCAHADPSTPCVCTYCIGAGHGWITARAQDAGRVRFDERVENLDGDVFATIPAARDGGPTVLTARGEFNAAPILIDGEEW